MRILQINVVSGHGSTGKIASDIMRMLLAHGEEAFMGYGFGSSDFKDAYRITSTTETRINVHLFAPLGMQGRGTKYGTRKFLRWVSGIKPDIIHLHNIHGQYINYPLLFDYINKHNIPVVWTMHDCWSVTGQCAHFSSVGCEKWKVCCNHCEYNGTYKEKSIFDRSKTNYNIKKSLFTSVKNLTMVPVSNWLKSIVEKSFLGRANIAVINNGIDVSIFKPRFSELKQKHGISQKKMVLGVASEWSESKGLNEFIELSKDERYQIVLVGVSKEITANLPQTIIAVERTKNQVELAEYYSAADVFVNPTYNDSFPTVNIEALACGTPVVTYNTDGSPEIVDDINVGVIVEKGNVLELKKAVEFVLNKGKESYSTWCVSRVKERYEKESQYLKYYDLYKQILSNK